MTIKKTTTKESTSTKDKTIQTIIVQLQTALPALKEQLGEKKFERRIKKAAKLLIAGIKKTSEKKTLIPVKKVDPVKKAAPAKKAVPVKKKIVKSEPEVSK